MRIGSRLRVAPSLYASVWLLVWSHTSAAQQPSPQPSTPPSLAPSPQSLDPATQIDALIRQSNDQLNAKGQVKQAEQTAEQAVELAQKIGDKPRAMMAMLYLGSAYYYEGRSPEALEVFQKTAELARAIGNKKGLSRALNNAAGVLGDLGRYEESLGYFYQCMDVARELGDVPMQYTALKNIGDLYVRLGDPDKAEEPLEESLRLGRQLKHSEMVNDPAKVATEMSLLSLGEMELAREHYTVALDDFEQVRAIHPDNPLYEMQMLEGMAEAHQKLGEPEKSIELLTQALPLAEKTASGHDALIFSNLGESQESLGHFDDALASENRALALLRQHGGNPDDEWMIESRMAHINRALGHNDEALRHYQASIEEIERLRGVALNTERGRAGVLAKSRDTYAETADLLFEMHREADALTMAERGRARAFLDMLALSRSDLADDLTAEQRRREDAILARISAAQKNLWKEDLSPDEQRKYRTELAATEDDLEAFRLEVRQSNPRYASVHYPEPTSVSQIQASLLDDHTAIIEYLLGEKRSLVWIVTKNNLTTSVLPPRKEIEDQVDAYRQVLVTRASALTLPQSQAQISRLGAKLSSSLFEPVRATIASAHTLIIVPDGSLNYLPFETLVAPHQSNGARRASYLVEKFTIVYAPSASALVTLERLNRPATPPPKTLLAFGDPVTAISPESADTTATTQAPRSSTSVAERSPTDDYQERGFSFERLPSTRQEVLAISKLFPVSEREVYLGEDARKEKVKSENLDQFRFIHFATHGFIDEAKPDRSGILLSRDPNSSEDGVLQMDEIMRLRMNADMVTLSACSTGLGKLVSGEGVLGLTRAFFYSGARNVTVSLWNVNDSATAVLMQAYYANLKRGVPESAALREAKLTLLHGKNVTWSQPYFWAAFVLVGEGK